MFVSTDVEANKIPTKQSSKIPTKSEQKFHIQTNQVSYPKKLTASFIIKKRGTTWAIYCHLKGLFLERYFFRFSGWFFSITSSKQLILLTTPSSSQLILSVTSSAPHIQNKFFYIIFFYVFARNHELHYWIKFSWFSRFFNFDVLCYFLWIMRNK